MAESLPATPPEPSIGATLLRAVDLAQRVAVDEVRLIHLETKEQAQSFLRRGAWIAAGTLCLLLAWLGFFAAAVVVLEPYFSLAARLGLVAGSHAILGGALLGLGLRRRGDEP